jgi:cardiolipin synthase
MSGVLTVPNLISTIRILAVPVFLWILFGLDEPGWAGFLLGWIGATDWVDGYLARRLGQVSELGKFLDPLADRLAIVAAVIGGWIAGVLPWPVALLLVIREGFIVVGALVIGWKARAKLAVRETGKAATLALYGAIAWFYIYAGLGHPVWLWLAWIFAVPGLVLYYVSAAQYTGDMVRLLREEPEVSSS